MTKRNTPQPKDPLYIKVKRSLDVAVKENGYEEMLTWTPAQIIDDLMTMDSDFSEGQYSYSQLENPVRRWLMDNA